MDGECVLQYTQDENYQQLSEPLTLAVNSSFELPELKKGAEYFFQARVALNSDTSTDVLFVLRTTFVNKIREQLYEYLSS